MKKPDPKSSALKKFLQGSLKRAKPEPQKQDDDEDEMAKGAGSHGREINITIKG